MANRKLVNAGIRLLQDVITKSLKGAGRQHHKPQRFDRPDVHDARTRNGDGGKSGKSSPPISSVYPGDYTDRPEIIYSPIKDGLPDPGEIVWTWVPYEEDHAQGKDRPALIIGVDGDWLLALQVTSKDHDRDARQEASQGRYWEDIGTGAWDNKGRPSEVRLNRIIRIDPGKVRRIGAILDEQMFDFIAGEVLKHY